MTLIGQAVSEKKLFENRVYIHVHDSGTWTDNSHGVKTNKTNKDPLIF